MCVTFLCSIDEIHETLRQTWWHPPPLRPPHIPVCLSDAPCYNATMQWITGRQCLWLMSCYVCYISCQPATTGPWSRAMDSIQTDTGIMSGPEIVEASQAPLIYDKPRLNELKL